MRIDAIVDETPDIRAFRLVRSDGEPFDRFEPGAHVDVLIPDAPVRQYSLFGDPGDRTAYWFAVKKERASRGGSLALHERVQVGDEIRIGAPRNLFRLQPEAARHILIAAGIGITPLLSMAHHLLARDDTARQDFTLHYFVRSEPEGAFIPLLREAPFARHVQIHAGIGRERLDDALNVLLADVPASAQVYTCGPAGFMEAVVEAAARHLPADHVHLERFGVEQASGAHELATEGAASAFDVVLGSSGQRVNVPAGTTIVEALATVGIEIDTSCGEGICGTCIVDVVQGEPDHRDHCLSKAEKAGNQVICCCVSRARSAELVLDL